MKLFGKSLRLGGSGSGTVTPGDDLFNRMGGSETPLSTRDLAKHWAVKSVVGQVSRGLFGVDCLVATQASEGLIRIGDQRGAAILQPHIKRIAMDVLRFGAFLAVIATDSGGTPRELVPLKPDETTYEDGEYKMGLESWPESKVFTVAEEIPWCSPLDSLRSILEEDIYASEWRRFAWKHSPLGHIERGLDAPEWSSRARERFQRAFKTQLRGDTPRGLDGGVPLLDESMTWHDARLPDAGAAQFIESRKLTVEIVCDVLGVQSSLLGTGADKQIAAARRQMLHGPVADIAKLVTQAYQGQLAQRMYGGTNGSNISVFFDIPEGVSREEEDPSLTNAAVGTPWRSVNEQRARVGLEPVPNGDNLAQPPPKAVVTQ